MIPKTYIAFVSVSLLLAAVFVYFLYGALQLPQSTTTTTVTATTVAPVNMTSSYLLFPESNLTFFPANGTSSMMVSNTFMSIGVYTPIPVNVSGALIRPSGNLSVQFHLVFPNYTVLFLTNPVVGTGGLQNSPALLNYSTGAVNGITTVSVYSMASPWTIYTNGTSYYVVNGTYSDYVFAYVTSNTPQAYTIDKVPESSPLFPQMFAAYLSSVSSGGGTAFASQGTWWYSGHANGTFISPGQPQAAFHVWS